MKTILIIREKSVKIQNFPSLEQTRDKKRYKAPKVEMVWMMIKGGKSKKGRVKYYKRKENIEKSIKIRKFFEIMYFQ